MSREKYGHGKLGEQNRPCLETRGREGGRRTAHPFVDLEREQGARNPLKAERGGYYDIDFALMYLRLKGAGIFYKVLNTPQRIDVLDRKHRRTIFAAFAGSTCVSCLVSVVFVLRKPLSRTTCLCHIVNNDQAVLGEAIRRACAAPPIVSTSVPETIYFSFSRMPFAVAASGAFGAIATNFVRSSSTGWTFTAIRPAPTR